MTSSYLLAHAYRASMALLPPAMDSAGARAMLLAIAWQESRLLHRRQISGPARGFWQFEKGGGVAGVLMHPATATHARYVCSSLTYPPSTDACYTAIEHNDVLACSFARLLLWTLPKALPGRADAEAGWNQYLLAWRPGKPHRETWNDYYTLAWEAAL